MGPHSTSDDPSRYRSQAEVDEWALKDPAGSPPQAPVLASAWSRTPSDAALERGADGRDRRRDRGGRGDAPAGARIAPERRLRRAAVAPARGARKLEKSRAPAYARLTGQVTAHGREDIRRDRHRRRPGRVSVRDPPRAAQAEGALHREGRSRAASASTGAASPARRSSPRATPREGEARRLSASSSTHPRVDAGKLQDWKEGIVKKLTGGVRSLFKTQRRRLLYGEARVTGPEDGHA